LSYDPETSLGGVARAFPDTTWGMVSRLGNGAEREVGLDTLARRYWKPVYCYVRARWRRSNEDAKDITQAFFLWLCEREVLSRYTPEKGTLRAFLKTLLARFVSHRDEALRRLKRGGEASHVSLTLAEAGLADAIADPKTEDPDQAFDRAWRTALFDRALSRLRETSAEGKRAEQLRVFEAYDLAAAGAQPTYAEVAARLGLRESDVRNHLFAVRERLRRDIRSELLDTVSSPRDLEEEWDALFAA